MAINPVPRSVGRMSTMVDEELRRGEKLTAALPVWIGGTYVPFLGSIVVAVGLAAGLASGLQANALIVVALGAFVGAVTGRWLANRAAADHPVQSRALQLFVGITDHRVLIYEPKTWGKPGSLLAAIPTNDVGDVTLVKGNFIRPSRLSFLTARGLHEYEFSGLWDVDEFVDALT